MNDVRPEHPTPPVATSTDPGARVRAYLARPPSRALQLFAVVASVWLPIVVWQERGAAVGLLAFAVYPPVFLYGAFGPRPSSTSATGPRWTWRRTLALVPCGLLCFLALAGTTDWTLSVCAAVSAAFVVVASVGGAIYARSAAR